MASSDVPLSFPLAFYLLVVKLRSFRHDFLSNLHIPTCTLHSIASVTNYIHLKSCHRRMIDAVSQSIP